MLNMLCPMVCLFPKQMPPLSKKGLIWLKGDSYSLQKCNCWLKIVSQWDKRNNGAMCGGKEIKCGLELFRMETKVATCIYIYIYIYASSFKKKLNMRISILFFCEFLGNQGLSPNVGLLHLEIGLA